MKFKLLLSSFICVLFVNLLLAIYFNQIDRSSYTDWISAFCNIVMAGATVSAVIAARNYLAQFTAQEGYKIAISLVNDDLLKIKDFISLLISYNELHKIIDDNSHFVPRQKQLGLLKPYISDLYDKNIAFDKYVNELKTKVKKLHTYGLEISSSKRDFFDSIIISCDEILKEVKDLLVKAQNIARLIEEQYKENKRDNYDYDNRGRGVYFTLNRFKTFIPHVLENINDEWKTLMDNYELFFSNDNSITDIFKVKKAQ
ncbi:TPA: hypothetical protein RU388_005031 [Klebsiella pneumoniae]|uniref:hypothetical protein n=1 Tax=Klebsiella pneumoniae TaxID=573 RepID=UPI0028E02E6E|nr:hypothetical protein [Klebsiella pneumoniae]HBY9983373.1 hypothetical protein [Klebsiella pneumoniae]HBZ7239855.1 hypothetical protein [Klebsiella pneumoniae]HBZ7847310.1 hypothetical protein [Klebsiella pneumoniae]HDZ9713043.1 hypothetical protein [Klebsiella pneumoniae]